MPCYDPRDNEPRIEYRTGISPDELARAKTEAAQVVARAADRVAQMEGVVCALMNELERRGIGEEVVAEASRNGLIDIMSIWVKHKNDDESRIAHDLHTRYSKDEQAILKKLLGA